MPYADVNGTSLYYEDTGPGSTGKTIAFSHGLLWGTELFAPQIAALRDRYRCIAWDHRGQGRSGPEYRHTIPMELVWQDAIALLDELNVTQTHLAGLSMGGFVAMRIAARRPALVDKLGLLETSADPEPVVNVARYRLLSKVYRVVGGRPIANRVAPIMMGKSIIADQDRKAEVAGFVKLMTRRRDVWKAVNGVIDRAGIASWELALIRAPTLVVVGDEDLATPLAKAEALVAAISGAKLAVIPGAGHSSTVEQPAEVTLQIARFLDS
jgi:pimeloyl-ACP methyl ester carboxylesterase